MALKAVKDIINLDGLIQTFLVFSAYFYIIIKFLSLVFKQYQTNTMMKTISKLHKLKG